jgi:hypothetical protein
VEIKWPGGNVQKVTDIKVDQITTVVQNP